MKIAFVVHDARSVIGQGRYVLALATALAARHEVAVFANRVDDVPAARWRTRHVRAWRATSLTTVLSFPAGLELAAGALRTFDVRHAQGLCGRHANVVTAHICVAAYLDSLRAPTWRTRRSLALMAAAEARFYRQHRGPVIAVSARVAGELRERYAVPEPIHVGPHGVDLAHFDVRTGDERRRERVRLGVGDDETVALYVGDLAKAHTSLRALAEAAPEIRLVVVTGTPGYRWAAPNVVFHPPAVDIARSYAAADALVFPSTYDAFGMVVLEAMACGLPVFVSDAAGAAALVDGTNGLALPLPAWVDATVTALRDRDRLAAMGKAARATAERHPWSAVASAVEAVYRGVTAA
jgi:UDP-glucose:(heptosyl)LPS alpha-1,3-glucosyltransferase